MTPALAQLVDLVYRESGIRLAERQHPFLLAALDRVHAGAGPEGILRRVADPLQRGRVITRLIEEVTVKETSFLRDHGQLEAIDWRALARQAEACGTRRIRVWTAACATGEEAYSLAMLASEAFAPNPPPVNILATDISADALARARLGRYRARSVRGIGPALRARYLRQEGDGLIVGEELRSLVRFARHNLIRDPFPPLGEAPFDLILCRNVLIYFDSETVARVLESFERARAPSGSLVLGTADVLCASASRMAMAVVPAARVPVPPSRTLRQPLGRLPDVTGSPDAVGAPEYFRQGLAELENGDPAAAVSSLRRALYLDPHFGLAAFKLGGAHEALGDLPAARRVYRQALRALEQNDEAEPLGQVDLADVATATRTRLGVLGATTG